MNDNRSKNSALTSVDPDDGHYAVMLPCSPEAFGDFVSGLLGKPQTIEKQLFGVFEIGRDDIENLYHLIDQRVLQQNGGTLIQFVATIGYDDNSSVRLNSFHDFKSYSEVRPKISKSISMSWTYLIHFPQRPSPEKQEINIVFRASGYGMVHGAAISSGIFYGDPLGFDVRINHTARSWGVDMESLLVGHLETLKKQKIGSLRKFAAKYDDAISVVVALVSFLTALIGLVWALRATGQSRVLEITSLLSGPDVNVAANASKMVALEIISGNALNSVVYAMVYLVVMGIFSITFAALVSSIVRFRPVGALLLTKESQEFLDKQRLKEKRVAPKLIGSAMLAIVLGVLSNFSYQYIVGILG